MVLVCRGTKAPKTINFLEYIESSGEQWIDTDVYTNQDSKIFIDATILLVNDSEVGGYVCGSSNTSGAGGHEIYTYDVDIRARFGMEDYFSGRNFSPGDRVDLRFIGRDFTVSKNGVVLYSTRFNQTTFTSDTTLKLFRLAREQWMGKVRIHSCEIYDGDSLIRSYLPCIDDAGNVSLYDSVSGTFVYNSGSGQFIAGPEV